MWRKHVVKHEVSHNQRAPNNIATTRCTYKVRFTRGEATPESVSHSLLTVDRRVKATS